MRLPIDRSNGNSNFEFASFPKPLFLLFHKLEVIRILILEFQRIKCTIADTICHQC
jgi:hypothetical protein